MLKAELEKEYAKLKSEYTELEEKYLRLTLEESRAVNEKIETEEICEGMVALAKYETLAKRVTIIMDEIELEHKTNKHIDGLVTRILNKLSQT